MWTYSKNKNVLGSDYLKVQAQRHYTYHVMIAMVCVHIYVFNTSGTSCSMFLCKCEMTQLRRNPLMIAIFWAFWPQLLLLFDSSVLGRFDGDHQQRSNIQVICQFSQALVAYWKSTDRPKFTRKVCKTVSVAGQYMYQYCTTWYQS